MEMMMNIATMVILGIAANGLATLKTILVAKKAKKPVYLLTFIDALLFGTILKQISVGNSLMLIFAYAIGRVLGYVLGNLIEDKLALGSNEIEVSLNNFDKMVEIADHLRDSGHSVETYSVYGYKGKKRYKISITARRKLTSEIIESIKSHGYEDPTFKVREIQKMEGKFLEKISY